MILAIATQKGGSAKTTTSVHLGAALAERGKRVAIVDLDPQAHTTFWLLRKEGRQWGPFLHEWLEDPDGLAARPSCMPGLEVIPSNQDLARIRDAWNPLVSPEDAQPLARVLERLRGAYDWVLLDCPASFDALTVSALISADGVIVPVAPPEPLAIDGVNQMVAAIARVQTDLNPRLRFLGVVVSNVRLEYAVHRHGLERMEQARLPLFSTMIAASARIGAAADQHRTVIDLAPKSFVADSYRVFSMEVEKRARGWLWNWVAGTARA